MLSMLIINVFVLLLGAIFSPLPDVTSLPYFMGYDIDGALVTAVGQFKSVITSFWVYEYMFGGLVVLLGYYVSKNIVLRFFLGNRIN